MEDDDDSDYFAEEPSDCEDEDESSSSDDEFEEYMKKIYGIEENAEADFEKEMDDELNKYVKTLEETTILNQTQDKSVKDQSCSNTSEEKEKKYYDDIYFSSGSDDEGDPSGPKKVKKKHPVISNDELFYDPEMDKDDQKWVDDQRRSYIFPSQEIAKSVKINKPLQNSDAVLNCPACLTLLCLDCQRHEIYKSQYRAIFVKNCIVDSSEILRYPNKQKKKMKRKWTKGEVIADINSDDVYNPVKCAVCNTQVAVFDSDEVYHFFNVLAGFS